ncbi:unnamed protein product [Enterobius vermicularis]|uniref:CPG4 domain-containing protein n=1 Tax=Enterobius vermicularis TaxID=51028 RepID=A0A0N4VDB7_ENTVE|nr:unnamed protein product [Enterobius vermicularis]
MWWHKWFTLFLLLDFPIIVQSKVPFAIVDFVINAVTEDKTDILFAEKLVPRSPLDRNTLIGNGQALTNKTEEEVKIGTTRSSEMLYVKGIHVPDCARGCTAQLFATLDVAVKSGNNFERFNNVCDRFNETVVCLANLKHCGSFELFETLSSGMAYMCIEQREAFTAVIECIDQNAAEIKDGCAKTCNAQGIFTGWAVYAALRDAKLITPQIGKVPSKEVLVRPIAVGSESVVLSPLSNFAKLMLPDECGFLTSAAALGPLRIDKKLDEDLRRTYNGHHKIKEFKYILPNSTVTNEKPNPFTKELSRQKSSPLEDDNFDRDELWRTAMESRSFQILYQVVEDFTSKSDKDFVMSETIRKETVALNPGTMKYMHSSGDARVIYIPICILIANIIPFIAYISYLILSGVALIAFAGLLIRE